MIAPRLPMTVSQVKPLSVRDGKPGWAQSGVTVPSAHKGIFNSHILTILKTDFLLPSSQRGPDLTTMKTSRKFPLLPSPSPLHSHPKRKEFILQSTSSAKCFHSPGQVDGHLLWSPFRVCGGALEGNMWSCPETEEQNLEGSWGTRVLQKVHF